MTDLTPEEAEAVRALTDELMEHARRVLNPLLKPAPTLTIRAA